MRPLVSAIITTKNEEFYEDVDLVMDIQVYAPEEFLQIKNRSFIKKAFEEGIIIYDSQV